MSRIRFAGVTKRFDDVVAIEDLDLEVDDGEFLVLLGPSGCGKSTALRILAGLETPSEGTIAIDDEIVNDVDARRRDVAMVFQSYALYPHMSVAKNIESPLIGRGEVHDRAERRRLVRSAAEMLGLIDLLNRKPSQLSGGQRQRVALARAIVRRPGVFLMDEPLSNLDAKLRTSTRSEIVDLHRELDTTFVYVTHDQVEAMTMATRIAVLVDGRLQQVGAPREIYERPSNLFVARFIGSPPMNTLAATVVTRPGGEHALAIGDHALSLDARWGELPDGPVVLGVRPEHLEIADRGLPAEVVAVDWLGHEQIVKLRCAGSTLSIRAADERPEPPTGETVTLGVEARHLHLFDAETSERLPARDE